MAKKDNKEVLEVGVDVEAALADMAKLQRGSKRQFEDIAKAVDELDRKSQKANSNAVKGAEEVEIGLGDLARAYKREAKEIDNVLQNIEILSAKSAKASKEDQVNLEEQIKGLKEVGKAKIKNLRAKEKEEGLAASKKTMDTVGGQLKEDITQSLRSFSGSFSRDLKGSFESGAKLLVKSLKLGSSAAAVSGHFLRGSGANLRERGREKGGVKGAAMSAGGTGMKAIGGLINSMGSTLKGLGAVIGVASTSLMAVVKLLIDMDAKAKEFNKDILESASNAEFLGRNVDNVDVAFSQMEDTLRGARDAAFSLNNLDWGITAKEHKAVLNVLNQEGVSLAQIHDDAVKVHGDLGDDAKAVQAFTADLTHLSVAFSRSFGVPLQEINQLQAEMVTELGSGLQDTALSFQRLKNTAADTGVSANKFFAMIRGVSQDLSLWGNRMEDAVNLLGRMNKYMNPRNAQKFFQTTMQGLKNMGRTDRLRLSLLAGQKKTDDVLRKDMAHKSKGLANQLGMSMEEFSKKFAEGPEAFREDIEKLDKSQQSAVREALQDAKLQDERAKSGTYGKALALRSVGAVGALEEKKAAITRFAGTSDLQKASATIGGQAMAENLGVSEEEIDQMIKFEMALKDQKKALIKQLKSGDDSQMGSAKKALKQIGIEGKDAEDLAKKVDAAGYQDIMDTFDDDTKKLYEGVGKTVDQAKRQGDLTQSWIEKFEVFVDFMMNAVYGILVDMLDTISSIPGIGKGASQKAIQKVVYESKDKDVIKAFQEASGDMTKFRAGLIGKGGLGKSVSEAIDKWRKASPEEREGALDFNMQRVLSSIDGGFKDMDPTLAAQRVQETLKDAGVDDASSAKVVAEVLKGVDFSQALKGSGIEEGLRDEALKKSLWFLDPLAVATFIKPKEAKAKGTEMAEGEVEAPQPPPKVESKNTSANPLAPETPKVVAPITGGTQAASTAAAQAPKDPTTASILYSSTVAEDVLGLNQEQLAMLQSVDSQIDKFKMDTGFLNGPYSKAMETSVLAAVRTALFEYYLYKDIDKDSMLNAMSAGGLTGRSMSSAMSKWQQGGGTGNPLDAIQATGNATGGVVTGINNGLAMVTAAAGEGLTSIGKGERIVPAGGGGSTNFQINVSGVGGQDLARIIEAKVVDGVHEYKRREKFT